MIEGLSRYTNWLKEYTNACCYSEKEIVADLQSLITHGYIEDYIYIYEVPYFEGESYDDQKIFQKNQNVPS